MTLENDFILFANTCTDIIDQATYAADPNTAGGRPSGIFPSNVYNKIARQSSYASAALAQLIVSYATQPAIDNANLSTFTANLVAAIQAIATGGVPIVPPVAPGGRLTLTTGVPRIAGDVIGSTVVYYTPTVNASFPLFNGSVWANPQLTGDLSLSLTSAAAANDIVDVFGTYSGSTPVLGFGPVWATNTPGSCARGVGAGTTQISRVNNGLWANTNAITLINGGSTYSAIPAGQATYLGSLAIDSTAGQVSCYSSYGQSRKWGVWNAYNRLGVYLLAGDSTASWVYTTPSWRNSNGNAANSLTTFTGLAEEQASIEFGQMSTVSYAGEPSLNGIGYNSTSSPSGLQGKSYISIVSSFTATLGLFAKFLAPPSLGLNTVSALEFANTGCVFYGTQAEMLLSAIYRA
jgi:hypothetical protein